MTRKSTSNSSRRQNLALLAVCAAAFVLLVASGCSKSESVTVQIDLQQAIDVSNKARSPGNSPRKSFSAFTTAANLDGILRGAAQTDEFRQLDISKRFARDDDAAQTKLLAALADMCSISARDTPASVRLTVAGRTKSESTMIANIIARTVSEGAMNWSAANLASRRELEHESQSWIQQRVADLERTVREMEMPTAGAVDDASPSGAGNMRTPQELAAACARREIAIRELDRARSEEAAAQSRGHIFDDLVASVVACPTWIVPASTTIESGWVSMERVDRGVALIALGDPAAGREWLARALSPTEKTVSAAAGDAAVSTTAWRTGFDQQARVSNVALANTADAAATSDLAGRVQTNPLADGTIIALSLTGKVTEIDRRLILNSLVRCVLAKRRTDINLQTVDDCGPLERRVTLLSAELREREWAFVKLAERSDATAETIATLFGRSSEGREIERLSGLIAELRERRKAIEFEAKPLFEDIFVIRDVQAE